MSKKKKLKIEVEETIIEDHSANPNAADEETAAEALPLFENSEENWDPLEALKDNDSIESTEEDINEVAKDLIDQELGQDLEDADTLEAIAFTEEAFTEVEVIEGQEAQDMDTDEEESNSNGGEQPLELMAITDDEAISVIESLLFISDRPVGLTTFKNAFVGTTVTTKKIKELIAELQADFAQIRRGVTLEEIDGAFQIRTKVDNQDFIKKIVKAKTFKLTGPSLETLAVIAYKQPCVKSDVDEVRGVESGHLVRALMDKGLVTFAGKSELPGKPMLYKTTRKFLEIFGLRNINELPSLAEMEDLLPEGIDAEEDKQTLSDLTGELSENYEGNYSVAEDELGKITDQLAGISTKTEFFEEEKRKQKEKQDRERAESINEALALGESVEDKDRKWLERYETKLAEEQERQQQALEAKATESNSSGETTEEAKEDFLEGLLTANVETEEGTYSQDEITLEDDSDFDSEDSLDDLAYETSEETSVEETTTPAETEEDTEDPLDLL